MTSKTALYLALLLGFASVAPAAIVGTNVPAQSITAERIAGLPWTQRGAWKKYLDHSTRQREADQAFFRNEMKEHGLKEASNAPPSRTFVGIRLSGPAEWYAGEEARRIADIIVSFQTPAGGWSKRLDMTRHVRFPGELFTTDNNSRYLSDTDFDTPHDVHWNYVGTFDNDATTTQLWYLAKVIAALKPGDSEKYRASFLRGLDYIFAAQFPNGGWPQVWPLQGGYHDTITYNDGAMVHVLELLFAVQNDREEFAFVPAKTRKLAAASLARGVKCVVATQIVVNGRRTVWCQQHDAFTLEPASARNYEMPSLCSAESAGLMIFLMKLPDPDRKVVAAVQGAAAWLQKTAVRDVAFRNVGDTGRHLVPAPGEGPIWSRYYEIGTDRPIFGDRDKSIHDSLDEISRERRAGYSWYGDSPLGALDLYRVWSKSHPAR
jgi:PelA/Pel-15E family pectate lyase